MNLVAPTRTITPGLDRRWDDGIVEAEQVIIATALNRTHEWPVLAARLTARDFVEPVHALVWSTMETIATDGLEPTIPAVLRRMPNRDEPLTDSLTVEGYVMRLFSEGLRRTSMTARAAIEFMIEARARRTLGDLGSMLAAASGSSGIPMSETIATVLSGLDEVSSMISASKRSTLDGAGLAAALTGYLDGKGGEMVPTGLDDLDTMIGGWPRGQLSIVAGRPGMGKSAAALHFVKSVALKGRATMFFSLEMTAEQIATRMACDLAYTQQRPIEYRDALARRLSEIERQRLDKATAQLATMNLVVEEQRQLTASDVATRARKHRDVLARDGETLDLVVVDHLGLLKATGRYAGNRHREIAEMTEAMASLAKDLDCAVVVLAQLNRGVEGREDKRPSLSDLRDSGSIEEDASVVVFTYRPAYYLEKPKDDPDEETDRITALEAKKHCLEFIVAKNRNGATGVVDAFCAIGSNAIRLAAYEKGA